ncbi:helix-turn-helix domain-containing protein [Streptomyces iconiensis]|uniref:Helix-turn-helix transcriptional regulator n=1 Tax=Streptomyces iconiensis TaxID=1384038 RepID=A0ABT6ZUQ7_9ACTN|nr:helix-turn-helix transcriptional regulator [Streptomyces iconiensis]MDJ1132787.1 helix-turn-helix transcriptional regulator [Streptomyces iconiensis]
MSARHFDRRRLRAVRRAAELTQGDVAREVGVADPTVASWETGQSAPDGEKLPALARALGKSLDGLFPRSDPPDLTDLRCDAGYSQYQTKDLIGTRSAGPVANAERGKRRLKDGFVRPLADGYGVGVDELLAAQERSFGHEVPDPGRRDGAARGVPDSLAEKITYLLDHSYPGDQRPPSDAEIAASVNAHAGARVTSEDQVHALRTGAEETASPIVREGLAELFGVSPLFFQRDAAVARQVFEGLRLLASARTGALRTVEPRGVGGEALSEDVLAFLNEVVAELQERELPADGRDPDRDPGS